MLTMSHDELQALVAGYALGILDEEEKKLFEEHLPGCADCRADLAGLQGVADDLSWSLDPLSLPEGHLNRFRDKVKASGIQTQVENLQAAPQVVEPTPLPPVNFEDARSRRRGSRGSGFTSGWLVVSAAAVLLFVTAAVFGYLFLDANSRLSSQEANARTLAALLASPNLKVTELQPTNSGQKSSARLLADTRTNQAVLVSQDLASLPDDKAYQVWLIGADDKPQSAAIFARNDQGQPVVVALSPPGAINQYKVVAITVEKREGSTTGPTTNPFTAGNIS